MFSSFQFQGFGDGATASSSKSHSEAEKHRRDRINGQLQNLRKLTPKSEKMDKAALLANVIEHVKELKIKAADVSKAFTVPSDVDQVTISTTEYNTSCGRTIFLQVSMCCEDRPELFGELSKALHILKVSIVQAEMVSLGCRVQFLLLLSTNGISNDQDFCNQNGDMGLINLMRTLRASLNRVVNSAPSVSSYRVASKRQRFFSQG